ncbi:hypothetical protein [Bacillus sp. V2I10]|uniref:hypothetical protein n=1 Tax=Bacillus sp. V2I10 TaxID=3042276 RepID=UPI0027879C89|nr:hypothetical protein [Bacillus sp. V2I10]MDQ0862064.1 glucan phosphoethanolaminetransferase (alkaline phosphatase superfamily) [Bacillus sp. V2I10]
MKLMIHVRDLAVTQGSVTALLFLMIPLVHLFSDSPYRWAATLHGLASVMTMIASFVTVHLATMLVKGNNEILLPLAKWLWVTNGLILLAIIFGNWLYIGYRAPDSVQQWLQFHEPAMHFIVMEFKEFVALGSLPFGVIGSILLRSYQQMEEKQLAALIAFFIYASWLCLLLSFVTGFGLALLKSV